MNLINQIYTYETWPHTIAVMFLGFILGMLFGLIFFRKYLRVLFRDSILDLTCWRSKIAYISLLGTLSILNISIVFFSKFSHM